MNYQLLSVRKITTEKGNMGEYFSLLVSDMTGKTMTLRAFKDSPAYSELSKNGYKINQLMEINYRRVSPNFHKLWEYTIIGQKESEQKNETPKMTFHEIEIYVKVASKQFDQVSEVKEFIKKQTDIKKNFHAKLLYKVTYSEGTVHIE